MGTHTQTYQVPKRGIKARLRGLRALGKDLAIGAVVIGFVVGLQMLGAWLDGERLSETGQARANANAAYWQGYEDGMRDARRKSGA